MESQLIYESIADSVRCYAECSTVLNHATIIKYYKLLFPLIYVIITHCKIILDI